MTTKAMCYSFEHLQSFMLGPLRESLKKTRLITCIVIPTRSLIKYLLSLFKNKKYSNSLQFSVVIAKLS